MLQEFYQKIAINKLFITFTFHLNYKKPILQKIPFKK